VLFRSSEALLICGYVFETFFILFRIGFLLHEIQIFLVFFGVYFNFKLFKFFQIFLVFIRGFFFVAYV
jgi:hypothetical protein